MSEHESCSGNERWRDREIKGESVCVREKGKGKVTKREKVRVTE